MNKPPQPITGPTSVPNPAPSPGLTQVRAAVLIKLFCGTLLLHPALSFSCVFPFRGGLWPRAAHFSCFCSPSTSTNEFCVTAKTGMGVPHGIKVCDLWCAPSPPNKTTPHIFPSHQYFQHCHFCFKALAEYVCVRGKACLLSFSLMSTLTSSLSLAVLPVRCRSSYFTPTGTNTPHCFLHMKKRI